MFFNQNCIIIIWWTLRECYINTALLYMCNSCSITDMSPLNIETNAPPFCFAAFMTEFICVLSYLVGVCCLQFQFKVQCNSYIDCRITSTSAHSHARLKQSNIYWYPCINGVLIYTQWYLYVLINIVPLFRVSKHIPRCFSTNGSLKNMEIQRILWPLMGFICKKTQKLVPEKEIYCICPPSTLNMPSFPIP